MDRRSLFASLFSLCLLAPIGCAATSADEGAEESVAETQDEITAAAHALVGKYYTHTPTFGGFARLTLNSNGKYTASVDPAGTALCVTAPCVIPESGTWNASKIGGKLRLRIRPAGDVSDYYIAVKSDGKLTLTAPGKPEQNLIALGANACLDNADCSANEECGPKLCLMWCAVDDPFCCGPSTCQPKAKFCGGIAGIPCGPNEQCVDDPTDECDPNKGGADCGGICQPTTPPPPPPPPSCWGAWKDQNGVCRTPADGVYPDSCCAGPTCGNAQCAAGQVCCNPLQGICTAPGEVCIQ